MKRLGLFLLVHMLWKDKHCEACGKSLYAEVDSIPFCTFFVVSSLKKTIKAWLFLSSIDTPFLSSPSVCRLCLCVVVPYLCYCLADDSWHTRQRLLNCYIMTANKIQPNDLQKLFRLHTGEKSLVYFYPNLLFFSYNKYFLGWQHVLTLCTMLPNLSW